MQLDHLSTLLENNSYPGRGIVLGRSADGTKAVIAYFIMGRSENSRNRVFVQESEGMRTKAFDPAKLSDPSLVIYWPVRELQERTIVTNGDQTDTIYEYLKEGKTFEEALRTRTFEPDAPNFTPRISGFVTIKNAALSYQLSILKSNGGNEQSALRTFFDYPQPVAGEAHFIHTYQCDGDPIPSFVGEPKTIVVPDSDIDTLTQSIWNSLNTDNKVSLFTRMIDLNTGETQTRIVNKNN